MKFFLSANREGSGRASFLEREIRKKITVAEIFSGHRIGMKGTMEKLHVQDVKKADFIFIMVTPGYLKDQKNIFMEILKNDKPSKNIIVFVDQRHLKKMNFSRELPKLRNYETLVYDSPNSLRQRFAEVMEKYIKNIKTSDQKSKTKS